MKVSIVLLEFPSYSIVWIFSLFKKKNLQKKILNNLFYFVFLKNTELLKNKASFPSADHNF